MHMEERREGEMERWHRVNIIVIMERNLHSSKNSMIPNGIKDLTFCHEGKNRMKKSEKV